MNLLDIVPPDRRDAVMAAIRNNVNANGDTGRSSRHIKADGSLIDVLTSWRPILFQDQHAQLAAAMDVTEQRRAEARIAYMARHDSLTGLPSRVMFHERLDKALPRVRQDKQNLAVLYLDLDHFKNVNDALAHPAGDKLLGQRPILCAPACVTATLSPASAATNSLSCNCGLRDRMRRVPWQIAS
jgi:hypothetical protein